MSFGGRVGGNTPLGVQLNRMISVTDHVDVGRFKTARAIIKRPYNDTYVFYMDLLDSSGRILKEVGPIQVIGTEDQLAMFYGSPQKMTGGDQERWEAIIFYQGTTVQNGIAMVARRLHEVAGGLFEATTTANELVAKGTSFAPPGPGTM